MNLSKLALAVGAAAVISLSGAPKPVEAQSQSTINTLLGAAAVVGGIILYNNYVHKKQAANQVVGYTRNGGTIYGDGRIVFANGATAYPNQSGQYPTGQYAYYAPNANPNYYAYDPQRTGRYDTTGRHGYRADAAYHHDNGLHRGEYKSEGREQGRGEGHGRGHDKEKGHDRD